MISPLPRTPTAFRVLAIIGGSCTTELTPAARPVPAAAPQVRPALPAPAAHQARPPAAQVPLAHRLAVHLLARLAAVRPLVVLPRES